MSAQRAAVLDIDFALREWRLKLLEAKTPRSRAVATKTLDHYLDLRLKAMAGDTPADPAGAHAADAAGQSLSV
jgi:hypothetical protein